MEKQFKEGKKYSGEIVYGGCAGSGTNSIKVIGRNGKNIIYQENLGKTLGSPKEAPLETSSDWGEYISVGDDRFFAYAVEEI